jgi:hypothetical protein
MRVDADGLSKVAMIADWIFQLIKTPQILLGLEQQL